MRVFGIYHGEHALGYSEESSCVCICVNIFMYMTTCFKLRHSQFFNEPELLFCCIWSLSWCYTGWKSVIVLLPRWVRNPWHNQLWSTRKRKGVEQRIIQRREERDKLVEEEMKKINLMMLGPGFCIFLPTCLSVCLPIIIHFLCVPLEMEATRGLFFVALHFSTILWSLFMSPGVPYYVIYSHTFINQRDLPLASTYRWYSFSLWLYIWPWHALASPTLRVLHIGYKTGKPGIGFFPAWVAEWHDSLCPVINPIAHHTLLAILMQIRHIRTYV